MKNKFKKLYYIGLSVYFGIASIIVVIFISIGAMVVNKIDSAHKNDTQETSKVEIPIVKKIIYDTVQVYDTIKTIAPLNKSSLFIKDIHKDSI